MKNFIKSRYSTSISLLVLLLAVCFSCVKEEDILSEPQTVVIPQEGEIKVVSGIVKDTTGTIIPDASIKIVLDELELETMSDENGEWSVGVPNSFDEGFIIANKLEYNKSINRYINSNDNQSKDIYLTDDPSNSELDLDFRLSELRTVKGRIVDENNTPQSNVDILIWLNLLDSSVRSNFQLTDEGGNFEIVYEIENLAFSTLFAINPSLCSDNVVINLDWSISIEDLGDIVLSDEALSLFQTNIVSDGSACYDNVNTISYWTGTGLGLVPNSVNQPLGDASFPYCLDENEAFYVGVQSDDFTHFNGSFFSAAEIEDTYMLDICTPNSGTFLELDINGNKEVFTDNLTMEDGGEIVYSGTENPFILNIIPRITSNSLSDDEDKLQIGRLNFFFFLQENIIYEDAVFDYANIIQDDDEMFTAVVNAKYLMDNNTETDIKIRVRIVK